MHWNPFSDVHETFYPNCQKSGGSGLAQPQHRRWALPHLLPLDPPLKQTATIAHTATEPSGSPGRQPFKSEPRTGSRMISGAGWAHVAFRKQFKRQDSPTQPHKQVTPKVSGRKCDCQRRVQKNTKAPRTLGAGLWNQGGPVALKCGPAEEVCQGSP